MKQLLIVKTGTSLNGGKATPKDIGGMADGSIGFFELGGSAWLAAAPTKNFGIALGRGTNGVPFVIPEVAIDNLNVVKAAYAAGAAYSSSITIPSATFIPESVAIPNPFGTFISLFLLSLIVVVSVVDKGVTPFDIAAALKSATVCFSPPPLPGVTVPSK